MMSCGVALMRSYDAVSGGVILTMNILCIKMSCGVISNDVIHT